MQAISRLK